MGAARRDDDARREPPASRCGRLSLRAHPLQFLHQSLNARRFTPCRDIATTQNGSRITIAGLVLVRQMPGSPKGIMFITLEV
jgi:error-prone DNA polymerase